MKRDFEVLGTAFVQCSVDNTDFKKGSQQIIDVIHAMGGQFLRVTQDGKPQFHPDPMLEIDDDGGSIRLEFEHELMARSPLEHEIFQRHNPTADLSYLRDGSFLRITQDGEDSNPQALDAMANGQLAISRVLYPRLRPAFVYTDEVGMNIPGGRKNPNPDVKYIFWATLFSPPYVDKYGRDFLLGAPVWKKDELDDGGILHVVTESYCAWWSNPPKDIAQYYHSRFPSMKTYRAKW
jgi:hypothetical protein